MNRAIALHKVKPVVDRIFPFADAVAAFRYMETGILLAKSSSGCKDGSPLR